MNIHDALNRLVLRARWVRWSLRNWKPGDYRYPYGEHVNLSRRLHRFRPIVQAVTLPDFPVDDRQPPG